MRIGCPDYGVQHELNGKWWSKRVGKMEVVVKVGEESEVAVVKMGSGSQSG
jgi:hypothetical protein